MTPSSRRQVAAVVELKTVSLYPSCAHTVRTVEGRMGPSGRVVLYEYPLQKKKTRSPSVMCSAHSTKYSDVELLAVGGTTYERDLSASQRLQRA